jgi:hypothetical protein
MTIAIGVNKQVKYKVESTWGTVPAAGSAQLLRRVSSDLDLKKETYESNEIRTDYQVADFRHGVRRVAGSIRGELSPLTYSDFLAAALRKAWAATASDHRRLDHHRGVRQLLDDHPRRRLVPHRRHQERRRREAHGGRLQRGEPQQEPRRAERQQRDVLLVTPLNGVALVAEGPIAAATLRSPASASGRRRAGHTG